MSKIHSGHLHISGPAVAKLMSGKKPGQKVKLHVHAKVESMESRDGMNEIFSSEDKKKKKAAPTHHMSFSVHNVEDAAAPDAETAADESDPQDEHE